jgi:hypothetical protein
VKREDGRNIEAAMREQKRTNSEKERETLWKNRRDRRHIVGGVQHKQEK